MTEARRALRDPEQGPRGKGALIAGAAIAALVLAAVTGAVTIWRSAPQAATPASAQTPERTNQPAPSPTQDAAVTVVQLQLQSCANRVAAQQRILDEAESAIARWREHVQAQTDANAGAITAEQRDQIFGQAHSVGAKDLERYDAAVESVNASTDGCAMAPGASDQLSQLIGQCIGRLGAQREPLRTADVIVKDFREHLAQRTQHDAQKSWNEAWAAAPEKLAAWDTANKAYAGAPSCTA